MKKIFLNLIFGGLLLAGVIFGIMAIKSRILHEETNPVNISLAIFALILSGLIFEKRKKIKQKKRK